jgi:hypothetical protein
MILMLLRMFGEEGERVQLYSRVGGVSSLRVSAYVVTRWVVVMEKSTVT